MPGRKLSLRSVTKTSNAKMTSTRPSRHEPQHGDLRQCKDMHQDPLRCQDEFLRGGHQVRCQPHRKGEMVMTKFQPNPLYFKAFVNAMICRTKTLFHAKMSSYEEAIKYVANQDLSHLDLQCQDYSTFSWFLFVLVLVCAAWLIKNKRRVAS